MFALTAPVLVAAAGYTGRSLITSFFVRGLVVAIILGLAWYFARRRGTGSNRD